MVQAHGFFLWNALFQRIARMGTLAYSEEWTWFLYGWTHHRATVAGCVTWSTACVALTSCSDAVWCGCSFPVKETCAEGKAVHREIWRVNECTAVSHLSTFCGLFPSFLVFGWRPNVGERAVLSTNCCCPCADALRCTENVFFFSCILELFTPLRVLPVLVRVHVKLSEFRLWSNN